MTDLPRTIPQVLDRIADQFSDHDALVGALRRVLRSGGVLGGRSET